MRDSPHGPSLLTRTPATHDSLSSELTAYGSSCSREVPPLHAPSQFVAGAAEWQTCRHRRGRWRPAGDVMA